MTGLCRNPPSLKYVSGAPGVSSVINKFPTKRSQFNFFYFLHKTIFLPYN